MSNSVLIEDILSEVIGNTSSGEVLTESPCLSITDGLVGDAMLSVMTNKTVDSLDSFINLAHTNAATDILSMQKEVGIKNSS